MSLVYKADHCYGEYRFYPFTPEAEKLLNIFKRKVLLKSEVIELKSLGIPITILWPIENEQEKTPASTKSNPNDVNQMEIGGSSSYSRKYGSTEEDISQD